MQLEYDQPGSFLLPDTMILMDRVREKIIVNARRLIDVLDAVAKDGLAS